MVVEPSSIQGGGYLEVPLLLVLGVESQDSILICFVLRDDHLVKASVKSKWESHLKKERYEKKSGMNEVDQSAEMFSSSA